MSGHVGGGSNHWPWQAKADLSSRPKVTLGTQKQSKKQSKQRSAKIVLAQGQVEEPREVGHDQLKAVYDWPWLAGLVGHGWPVQSSHRWPCPGPGPGQPRSGPAPAHGQARASPRLEPGQPLARPGPTQGLSQASPGLEPGQSRA